MPQLIFPSDNVESWLAEPYDTNPSNGLNIEIVSGTPNFAKLSLFHSTRYPTTSGTALVKAFFSWDEFISNPSSAIDVVLTNFVLNYSIVDTVGYWRIGEITLSREDDGDFILLGNVVASGTEGESDSFTITEDTSIPIDWLEYSGFNIYFEIRLEDGDEDAYMLFNGTADFTHSSLIQTTLSSNLSSYFVPNTFNCHVMTFRFNEEYFELDSGSAPPSGVYNEYYNSSFGNPSGALTATVELGTDFATATFNGDFKRFLAYPAQNLRWVDIGVPSGANVTEIYGQVDYSVLINGTGSDTVRVGDVSILYGDEYDNELRFVGSKSLTQAANDYKPALQSDFKTLQSASWASFPSPQISSNEIGIKIEYAIGIQANASQVDYITFDNLRICYRYTSFAAFSGSTTAVFGLTGRVDGVLSSSGKTDATFQRTAIASIISSLSGKTNMSATIKADARMLMPVDGKTNMSAIIGSRAVIIMFVDGKTNASFTISGKTFLSSSTSGKTDATFSGKAYGALSSSTEGKTIMLSNLGGNVYGVANNLNGSTTIDATLSGVGNTAISLYGKTDAILNGTALTKIYITVSGKTDVSLLANSIARSLSDSWSGKTNAAFTISANALVVVNTSGSTAINSLNLEDATGGIRNLIVTLSGKTDTSLSISSLIAGALLADGKTDSVFNRSSINKISVNNLTGKTDSLLLMSVISSSSSNAWVGSTSSAFNMSVKSSSSSNAWNGKTDAALVVSADARMILSTDGKTSVQSLNLEDGTGGIRNLILTLNGSTTTLFVPTYLLSAAATLNGSTSASIAASSLNRISTNNLNGSTTISALLRGLLNMSSHLSGNGTLVLNAKTIANSASNDWSGKTSSLFTISANAKIISQLSGKTDVQSLNLEDASGGVRNLILTLSGKTDSSLQISSLLGNSIELSGSTTSSMNVSSLNGMYIDLEGTTELNAGLSVLTAASTDSWNGETISDINLTASAGAELHLSGKTDSVFEQSTINEISTANWNGKTNASFSSGGGLAASTDNWGGSTTANQDISAIGVMAVELSGSTTSSANIKGVGNVSVSGWSGSTSSTLNITASGKLQSSLEGKTDSYFNIDDANEGVKNIYANWNGSTDLDVEMSVTSEASLILRGSTRIRKLRGSAVKSWFLGSVPVKPHGICKVRIGDVDVWS